MIRKLGWSERCSTVCVVVVGAVVVWNEQIAVGMKSPKDFVHLVQLF